MAKIYYFSGTGNSYRISKMLSEKIGDCKLEKITHKSYHTDNNDKMIGVIFPVYYFGLPKIVEDFLKNSIFDKDTYLFIIVTKGIPLSGGVKPQLMKCLKIEVSIFSYITMGDNFNIDFWNSSSNKTKINRNLKSEKKIGKLAIAIRNKEIFRKFALVDYLGLLTKNFPRYGYKTYIDKVYNSDQSFVVDNESCIKCNKCIKSCPVENIQCTTKIEWRHTNCQLCLACYHSCPKNAIQYKNGYLSTYGKKQYWNY